MFLYNLLNIYLEFLYAPVIYSKMLWILIPSLWAILLMDLYFDKYSREGIGHHKSLENTIFLVFISANLLATALIHPISFAKLYLSLGFIVFSIIIGFMDFFHKLPTQLIFKGSSKFVVGFFAYVSMVLVYSNILYDLNFFKLIWILISIIMLFITFLLVIKLVAFFEPRSYEEIEHFLKNIENDIKKAHKESEEDFKEITPKKKPKKSRKKKKK